MTQPYDERAERKRYIRRRQQIVFSCVGAVLAVALVVSALFYFHVGGLGITATSAVKPNYGVRVPCSTKDANGKNQTYSNYANVKVRVLNGTKFVGFAKAVSTALSNRQFKVTGWDKYKGKNAINEAYTLNTNFTDAVMVMDDRDDKLIDVVLGASFNDLANKDSLPSGDTAIENFEGCVPVQSMGTLPKSLDHEKVE